MKATGDSKGLTYTIIGGDGKEYGPASLKYVTEWIQQRRIRGDSHVRRSDQSFFSSADSFPELASVLNGGFPVSANPPPLMEGDPLQQATSPAADQAVKSGASWFYWIAGLSLINSVISVFGSEWGFILGLGITQIFDGVGAALGPAGKAAAFVMDLTVAGGFVALGIFAQRSQRWAFIVGMALYACDALLFLLGMDLLGIGFHGLALFFLFRGFQASRQPSLRVQPQQP